MNVLKGVAVYRGIVFGKLKAYRKDCFDMYSAKVFSDNFEFEISKFENAKKDAMVQLDGLYESALKDLGEEHAMIFGVHKMIIEDYEYSESVAGIIREEHANAEYAVWLTSRRFEHKFETMDNEYMQQRASDIRDISRRIINCMSNPPGDKINEYKKSLIIGCDDLSPSDLLELNGNYIKGFITMLGSKNSHTSILAKSMKIPSIISLGEQLKPEFEGCDVIIDGFAGVVYISPDSATIRRLKKKKRTLRQAGGAFI